MSLRGILIAVAAAFLATGAQAQLVVGTDDTATPTIFYIDLGTNTATPILTGSSAICWGMAYDHDTNTLYWNNGGTLYSSPFSLAGLTPTNLGTLTFNGAATNYVGLAYRAGKLLGTRNIATEAVYEIDPVSLTATQLYVYPSTFDFGGLDVDMTTGLLYGLSDTAPAGSERGLYEIDTAAMTTTFRAPYPAGETDIDGLAVYNGLAYYVIDQPGNFYIYDIASGMQVGTIPSPFTGSEVFSAAAYVPGGPVSLEETSWGHIKSLYR
jgi:hypothetical protein